MTALSPNALIVEYPDEGFLNSFSDVVTLNVKALPNEASQPQNLVVGASSNVVIEGRNNINMHVSPTESLNLYSTYVDNANARHETQFLQVNASNNVTNITGVNNQISLIPQDANQTVKMGSLVTNVNDTSQLLSTDQYDIKLMANTTAVGDFNVTGTFYSSTVTAENLIVDKNLTVKNQGVQGSMFGNNMNMYVNIPNSNANEVNRIGYGFFINSNNEQLELFKYKRYNVADGEANISADGKKQYVKVARFGFGELPFEKNTNLENVSVFDTLEDLFKPSLGGGEGTSNSGGSTGGYWLMNSNANLYFVGNVGINNSNPEYSLDIRGDARVSLNLTVGGNIVPTENSVYSLGSPTNRFKDLYLSGNTIVLGESKISTGESGGVLFLDSNNNLTNTIASELLLSNDTGSITLYTSNNNLGVGTTQPIAKLDVNGKINASDTITGMGYVTASDRRIKTDLVRLNNYTCLDTINKLHPYQYMVVTENVTKLGFIAQDVATVLPYSVEVKPNIPLGIEDFNYLDYNGIIASLVGAVQELDRKINALFGTTKSVKRYF